LADSGSKVNGLNNRFTIGGFTINYCKFYQMMEVITERDGMEGVADGFFLNEKKSIRGEQIVDSGGNEH